MRRDNLAIAIVLAIGMPPDNPSTLGLSSAEVLKHHMKEMYKYRYHAKAEFERLMVDQPEPYVDFSMWMPWFYQWSLEQRSTTNHKEKEND